MGGELIAFTRSAPPQEAIWPLCAIAAMCCLLLLKCEGLKCATRRPRRKEERSPPCCRPTPPIELTRCPYVSGTLALMMSYTRGLPRQAYVDCLLSTATNVDDANVPAYPRGSLGAGVINPALALGQCLSQAAPACISHSQRRSAHP